jgi:hypothetical protein
MLTARRSVPARLLRPLDDEGLSASSAPPATSATRRPDSLRPSTTSSAREHRPEHGREAERRLEAAKNGPGFSIE